MDRCYHCGMVRKANRRKCPHCHSPYCMAPDASEIAAAAAIIRLNWSVTRLNSQELRHPGDFEIPEAHRITDGMRRNDGESDAAK